MLTSFYLRNGAPETEVHDDARGEQEQQECEHAAEKGDRRLQDRGVVAVHFLL